MSDKTSDIGNVPTTEAGKALRAWFTGPPTPRNLSEWIAAIEREARGPREWDDAIADQAVEHFVRDELPTLLVAAVADVLPWPAFDPDLGEWVQLDGQTALAMAAAITAKISELRERSQ